MFISLQSYHHDVWAIQKEIKDAYPKKVCHMPTRHVKKKREKMHTQRRCATHPQGVSKKRRKRKYSPYQKYYKGERNHIKEFHPPSTKKNISTHLHILIKSYDLFLLWIRSLTQRNMRSKFAFTSFLPTDPPKRAIRSRMEKKGT